MNITETINAALEKIQYIAKTETVVGEPIPAGEVTLIPVSKVSIGFAAGGGGPGGGSGSGAGTGGGVTVTPVAFIAVSGDRVQVHPMSKSDPGLQKILSLAPDVIKKVSKYMEKKEKKSKPSDAKGKEKDAAADTGGA